jgi:branched-chain amino acid transport system substrate-binding protein
MLAAIIIIVIVIVAGGGYFLFTTFVTPPKRTIIFGEADPLTSPAGIRGSRGAQMAAAEINDRGGIVINGTHYQIVIVAEDTGEADPSVPTSQGVAAVTKLVTVDGANVLFGGYRSDVVLAETDVAARYKVVFTVESASPAMTQRVLDDYTTYKYIFQTTVNSTAIGLSTILFFQGLKDWATSHPSFPNVTNIGILGEDVVSVRGTFGTPMGTGALPTVLQKTLGYKMVYGTYFPLTATDFTPYMNEMAKAHVQLIIPWLTGGEDVYFMRDWSSYVWSGKRPILAGLDLLGTTEDYWNKTRGAAASEILSNFVGNTSVTPNTVPFYVQYYAKYKQIPLCWSLYDHDAVYAIADAIQRAQSLNSDKIVSAMENTRLVGVSGVIRYTKAHSLLLTIPYTPDSVPWVVTQWHSDGTQWAIWVSSDPNKIINFEPPH